jgi:putative Ca2+/H+ antiporter (TMEM165/GDT1 family)
MDLTPLIASFILFSLMEFGDKTHIAVITLSMKHRPLLAFAGALGAFAVVDGASVLVGGFIADLIPSFWINLISGGLFLLFGLLTLRGEEDKVEVEESGRGALASAFSLVSLMELGDKPSSPPSSSPPGSGTQAWFLPRYFWEPPSSQGAGCSSGKD